MLASTLYTGANTVTLDNVIRMASHEHRERQTKGETVNEHGLISGNKARFGSGRPASSRDDEKKTKWCSHHKNNRHNSEECWKLHPELAPPGWNKPKRKEKGMRAEEGADDSANEEEVGAVAMRIGEKVGLEAVELALASSSDPSAVILDSGATSPFIKDKHLLFNLSPLAKPVAIQVGNGKVVYATHTGTLAFRRVKYDNSYYVPEMSHNLLAVSRLGPAELGAKWTFSAKLAELKDKSGRVLMKARRSMSGGLWQIDDTPARTTSPSHLALSAKEEADIQDLRLLDWHCRLGHIDQREVWRLGCEGKLGSRWKGEFRRVECISCMQGKMARAASSESTKRATKPLVNVSVDLWGPARTMSREGYSYFLTCYDDYSKYVHVAPLKSKSNAAEALRAYAKLAENQLDMTIKTIRSDKGGEFTSKDLASWAQDQGIEFAFTPTAAHNQNGRVERMHLTLMNDVRTKLVESRLGSEYWVDALRHSVYTRNRVADSRGKIPLHLFKAHAGETEVNYNLMQAFGSYCVYRKTTPNLSKLDPRGTVGRMIGYGQTTAYLILDQEDKVARFSRDVRFTRGPEAKVDEQPPTLDELEPHLDDARQIVEPLAEADHPGAEDDLQEDDIEGGDVEEEDGDDAPPVPVRRARQGPGWINELIREGAPSPEAEDNVEAGEPNIERPRQPDENQARRSTRLRGGAPEARPLHDIDTVTGYIAEHALSSQDVDNPQTYYQARNSPNFAEWQAAMDEEMAKMDKYAVWEAVPREGRRTLSGKWVYTRKINGDTGLPEKFKARFVVRGFQQREGRDFGELFASVAHKDSIRVFLSIVNHLDLECDQVDIIGAFLNGDIDRELYVEPPQGSNIPANMVLRLRKSLYGLKQSPHLFNKKLDAFLRSRRLTPTRGDPCLYSRLEGETRLMVSVHVDDQLIASNCRRTLDQFKKELNDAFECKDQGPISYFLGINVYRDRPNRKMYLSQEHYLNGVIERFGEAGNPCKIALPSGWTPTSATDDEHRLASDKPYAQLVGSILYAATITRPDLAYPASVLCRYISKWSLDHWRAAKHLLRYIRGTSDLCLTFDASGSKRVILGWADADWGGCLDTRRSTTGYVFSTYGGIVAWKSKRQSTVALSTTQAELLASTEAGKQAVWLRDLLDDLQLGLAEGEPVLIRNDNLGAIQLAKHQHSFKLNKAFDMRAAWLREHQDEGVLKLEHTPTEKNKADLLTKSFTADKTRLLRSMNGLHRRNKADQSTRSQGGASE
jgi:hypothetical protein